MTDYPSWTGRTLTASLAAHGYVTIGDLRRATDADLLNVRGVGPIVLDGLRDLESEVTEYVAQHLGLRCTP